MRIAARIVLVLSLMLLSTRPAYAQDNIGLIFRGVAKTVGSVLQVPAGIAGGAAKTGLFFPIGMVGGALTGTMRAVAGTVSGGIDIARGGAPYAKYLVFL